MKKSNLTTELTMPPKSNPNVVYVGHARGELNLIINIT